MINNVNLMGRLTADPELRTVGDDEISVVRFCVACDRKGKDSKTDFINCQAWRGTADFIAKYFSKGDMIALVGALQIDHYEDKEGEKHTVANVVASDVSFCGGKSSKDAEEKPKSKKSTKASGKKKLTKEEYAEMIANGDIELPF